MLYLDPEKSSNRVHRVIDLVANKKPSLTVLEFNSLPEDDSSNWFDSGDSVIRSAYSQYDFVATTTEALISVQARHGSRDNASFLLADPDSKTFGLKNAPQYDLVIMKSSRNGQRTLLQSLRPLLSRGAFVLIQTTPESTETIDGFGGNRPFENPLTPDSPGTSSSTPDGSSRFKGNGNSSSIDSELEAGVEIASKLRELGHTEVVESTYIDLGLNSQDGSSAILVKHLSAQDRSPVIRRNLIVASFTKGAPAFLSPSLKATLETSGWNIEYLSAPFRQPVDGDVLLVIDELSGSILRHADKKQWDTIKTLAQSGQPLLWVTKGAQLSVTDPDRALVYGMFRVASREDHNIKFTGLDVQSSTSCATEWAMDRVLDRLARDGPSESQYLERNGVLHIQRIVPDIAVNDFKRAEVEGLEPIAQSFYGNKAQVMLRAERLGTLQSLTWSETDEGELPLEADFIEVKVMAVGVNFKDVAITMGIVPDNEYRLGFECAGVVTGVGAHVTSRFKSGDRVCIMQQGMYANRVRVHGDRCHVIPESMTYEEAATIPCVYLCSLYALYHLADLQEGQVSTSIACLVVTSCSLSFSRYSFTRQPVV